LGLQGLNLALLFFDGFDQQPGQIVVINALVAIVAGAHNLRDDRFHFLRDQAEVPAGVGPTLRAASARQS
jgi:hypothetical protein